VPEIDGLRFVAIIAVLLFHAHGHFLPAKPDFSSPVWAALSTLILQGWFGVQLFFIISGFILSVPFAEQRMLGKPAVPLKKYFLRRLTRLEPPYIINLVILGTLLVIFNGKSVGEQAGHFFASMFYAHNLAYHAQSTINHVAWTLEIEVQFYVLAPLLCLVFAIRDKWLRRGVVAAAILASAAQGYYGYDGLINMTLLGQIRFFLLGFLLADVYLVEWRSSPGKSWKWDVAGLAAWAAIPAEFLDLRAMCFAMPAALLVAYMSAFRGRLINRFFTSPWIVVIGGMCYTVYLYHVPLVSFVRQPLFGAATPGYDWLNLLKFAVVVVGVLAVSAAIFVLSEKPFMRKDWPARLAGWLRGRASVLARQRNRPDAIPQVVPVESESDVNEDARSSSLVRPPR
jgi:peptidoglycan/LPS O-acetylase OafA/YrhL